MRLLIVRHGDPDYSIDSLTEKGWKEAEYLSERLSKLDVKDFYVSPLGRAKDTASFTLKKMNRTAVECDWLREFDVLIDTILNLPKIPGGKKLMYLGKNLELTAIEDFEEKGKTDDRFKELAKITKEHNGLWSKEAEDYLLANF